jgi:cytoskeletal protein CcmA (bactofilin family)
MRRKRRTNLNGFLDAGSSIKGEVRFDDTFRIEGKLTGKAISSGDLVVGENGHVDGEIEVGCVFIAGTVTGSIKASERIEITSGARVFANLETPALVVENGAVFQGNCTMSSEDFVSVEDRESAVVTRLPLEWKSENGRR